jgi:hypothetical protein
VQTLNNQPELVVDEAYLLQFLRVRKFNMNETFQTFERMYLSRKRYPQFFDYTPEDFDKMLKLLETGYCLALSDRDEEGRKIILIRTERCDMNIYSTYDAIRLLCYVITVLLEEEETQIAGIICLFDHAGSNMKHLMTPTDVRDFMHFVKHCSACRQKGTYVMNLPSFANFLLEIFKSTLSEKLKKRFFLIKSKEDLKNHFDVNILPKSYGGKLTDEEMLADFKKLRDEKRPNLLKFLEVKIDWSKVSPEKISSKEEVEEAVGSFRKLEID